MKEEKDIQSIDKLFRQSLEGYSPAPPASVWRNIKSKLGNGGSSFVRFFTENMGLLVGSTVLICIVGILAYTMYFSKSTDLASKNESLTSTQNLSSDKDGASLTHSDSSNYIAPANKPIINSKGGSPVSENPKTKSNVVKANSLSSIKPETSLQSANKQEVKPEKTKTTTSAKSLGITFFETPNLKLPILNPSDSVISRQDQKKEITPSGNTTLVDADPKLLKSDSLPKSENFSANPVIPGNSNTELNNENSDISPNNENNRPISAPSASTSPASGIPLPKDNPKNLPEKSFSYTIGVSGSFGQEILKGINTNNFYSLTTLAGITHKKTNISLETGISYSYYYDQGSYEFDFRRSDTIGYTGYTLLNSFDSSYLIIYKPTIKDTLLSLDTITKTSYSYLKIPLYFSKQLFRSGKFSAGIKTGPSIEFLISSKETPPDYQLAGSTLLQMTNTSYSRLSTNWQWLIAPQFSWDITDKILFRVDPAVVFYLNNPYEAENRPSSKPYQISITGGLIFKFD